MDYKKSAADILTYIGGEKNVVNLEHCSTRLRFTVADQTLVDEANLKKVPGVIGVILNVQVQIVIGNAVIEVYNELMKLCKPQEQQSINGKTKFWQYPVKFYCWHLPAACTSYCWSWCIKIYLDPVIYIRNCIGK